MLGGSDSLSFGRDRRLRQGRDFVRLRNQGQRLAHGCLVANWQVVPANEGSRVGIITSRKIGGSVVRSRARRLLRESFRRHQLEIASPIDLVLIARPSIAGKAFADVEKDFLTTLRKARLLR